MASHDHILDDPRPGEFTIPIPAKMTEDEFVAWCRDDVRAEWVDGDVVMMTPANCEHSDVAGWLSTVIRLFVEYRDLGRVLEDVQVRFASQRRRRDPDILVLSKERMHFAQRTHVDGPPDLIVEIVSPDSQARDWREKYLEYEAAGVREYWIVDPMSERAEVYELAERGAAQGQSAPARYRRVEEKDGIIASTVLPGFYLRTAWLWPATRPKALEALRQLGVLGPPSASA